MALTDRFTEVNGLRLHYLECSSSGTSTLLFLHGITGHAHLWDHIATDLERQGSRTIALDQRGHGDSDWSPEGKYSSEDYVSDLDAFINSLGLIRLILVGHSMGALHAIVCSSRHLAELAGLVIVDIEACLPKWQVEFLRERGEMFSKMKMVSFNRVVQRIARESPWAEETLITHVAKHSVRQTSTGELVYKFDPKTMLSFEEYDVEPLLASVSCPTLIVRGAESPVMSREIALRMCSRIRECRFVEIAKASHTVFIDNPHDFRESLEEFVIQIK